MCILGSTFVIKHVKAGSGREGLCSLEKASEMLICEWSVGCCVYWLLTRQGLPFVNEFPERQHHRGFVCVCVIRCIRTCLQGEEALVVLGWGAKQRNVCLWFGTIVFVICDVLLHKGWDSDVDEGLHNLILLIKDCGLYMGILTFTQIGLWIHLLRGWIVVLFCVCLQVDLFALRRPVS